MPFYLSGKVLINVKVDLQKLICCKFVIQSISMRLFKIILLFTIFAGVAISSQAQSKSATRTTKLASKYKPPKLITLLSTYKDSAIVNAAEAEHIIAMPLRVLDDKKNVYTISSYQFLYRKKVVTEDEETGRVSPATSIISDRFKTSPLPEQWINKVREQIKAGELLYFFDIIAKDPQGRVMYAPEFKITVQ